MRKGWDALLRAYVREFAPTDGAALLLKVSLAHGYTLDGARQQAATFVAEEGQHLDERSDIILWHELLDSPQMANLYRSVDAFVLASRDEVDEIWAPSEFVKQVYVHSGVPPAKIHVIPWGVDPAVYTPVAPPLHLPHEDRFRFLFMGGTVERKGFDLLLRAYREEFTADELVALVIKDVGTKTFYRYGNRREEVLRLIAAGEGPPLVYLEEEMTDGTRASLYTACDCLAAPYRGEGFGLPVLEGMACGLAPIVPRGGATDDFVRDDTGYFVPAQVVECPHGWRMCAPPTELAIDIADLRAALRHAFEHRAETRERGQRASDFVRREFTWDQSVAKMIARLQVLRTELPTADGSSPIEVGAESTPDHRSSTERLDLSVCVLTKNHEGTIADHNGWHGEVRVFRNRNDIACECRGLERVTAAIRRIPGARILDVPFVIRRGVASADSQRLLRARLHWDQLERGRDPESLWGLGVAHARSGDFFHAESFLHDCWLGTPPDHPLHHETLKLLVECYRRIGDDYRASEFAERLKSIPGGAA